MSEPGAVERTVVLVPEASALAETTAARLLLAVVDAQSVRRPVHVVLTGGTVGIATLAAARRSPLAGAVDWSGVHLWWGDERYLPSGHPDRNETQAREALIDHVPVPAGNVHPMAGPDRAASPEAAALAYAADLARYAAPDADPAVPTFDVLLLGVGPDGHVASLFPGLPGPTDVANAVVGVHDSPKPPPQRVSLTFPAINAAAQVWLVAAGAEKAPRIAEALGGAAPADVPAAGAHGRERTLWLLDAAAAGASA